MQEIPHFNARSCPWSRVERDCSYRSCDKDLLRGGCNEIKTTHHPQLASKFVSRMELWLERLKDYYRATICFVPWLLSWYEPVARILPTVSLFTWPKSPFFLLLSSTPVSDGRWRQWIGNWWVSDLKSNPNQGILPIESVSKEAESSPIFPNFFFIRLRFCEADQVLKEKMTEEKWRILFKIRFSTPTEILFSLLVVLF